jgi:cation transport regulator ChaC
MLYIQEQTKKTFADAKSRYTFDKVLAICEKQACKIREDLENLEDHLEKYGYKRPAGII